jgi:phosphoglucosamine mutase
MSDFPQELISINVRRKPPISEVEGLVKVIEECEKALGESGRTIVRYSGTENKIRLLVEADTQEKVDEWIEKMSDVVNKELC